MLRFYYVILISMPFIIFYLVTMTYVVRHEERYTEEQRYHMARKIITIVKHNGRIETVSHGQELLPQKNGYIMFPNHQGKYDALGIMDSHDRPCTVVIDEKASRTIVTDQFIDLVDGVRMDKTDIRSQVKAIHRVADEVRSGRNYIIFAEGGYTDNKNTLQDFMPGAFKSAKLSQAPIVPVAVYDSYKPFSINSLKKVRTEVRFLNPIFYEEYGELNTAAIAELVKQRIAEEMERIALTA